MKSKRSRFRWLSVTLFFVVVLLLFKLGLTVGSSFYKSHLQISTPEVLAASEKKEKAQEPAAAPTAAPAATPATAPAAPSKKDAPSSKDNARNAAQPAAKPSNTSSVAETMTYLQQKEAELKKKEDQLQQQLLSDV
jgi:cytoskeletal protein RodZ